MDSYLFTLDSPTNPGNPNASSQTLLDSNKRLGEDVACLLSSIQAGKEDDIR